MGQKPKLKMGVIGVGHMGQYHVNVLTTLRTHKVVGIYDIDQRKCQQISNKYEVKKFSHIDKMLEQVDAVTIAVPTKNHYEYTRRALESGCHVLVEKPITETVEQAEELVKLADEQGKILQVGHVERFNGAVIELHKIVTDPLLIEARRLSPFTPRIQDVGVVLDILIHDLDIVLNLVKSSITSISSMGRSIESPYEDIAMINITFQNNCIANLIASRVSQKKERTLTITQNQNLIFLNYANQDIEIYRQAASAYLMTYEEVKYSQECFVEKLYIHKENPLKGEHKHFYECIVEGKKPIVSNHKDIEILSISLQTIQAIKNNSDIKKNFSSPASLSVS